ncbi:PQQ-binding-like beta-propeller repeat protein [Stieleria sp. ICT_E10.1]|uniref:outer membrane protein assembly factor BamB family protein n=1 Tax=Stieleria sedimenti TaxID=2976331 RepID=UPI00217F6F50|nr:PQQ-binding-like beta-propeller repeat protein [Stieleria sedimenti]MCS7468703.1 PQQ-binding-like beta-propeller repeat protein [Stieleria sedimenti]
MAISFAMTLAATSVTQQAVSVEPGDWAQYNYDNRGWRLNHVEEKLKASNIGTLEEKWRFPRRGATDQVGVVHATPVVVDGYVYFGTTRTRPSFYKLTPDGELCWCYEIESIVTAEHGDPYIEHGLTLTVDGVMNSALVDDQRVYFGTFGGQLICLDRFSGAERWKVNTKHDSFPLSHPANTIMSSPILADGKLIVAGGGFEHALGAIPDYPCCSGRGFVAAFHPENGNFLWGYPVGPEPEQFDPPVAMEFDNGERIEFVAGPSTSSVWCTPSYDPQSKTLFFGTDTHNAPRKPTPDDQRPYNKYSSAIIAIGVEHGKEKWVRQLVANDVWNNAIQAYDPRTGQYKDLSIGDTPKLYSITENGVHRNVLGVGCKNGAFYVIDRADGQILYQTPTYQGPPEPDMTAPKQTRILALPGVLGGLQTGCGFDGDRVYANGTDWPGLAIALQGVASSRTHPIIPPSAGRVTAISPNTLVEHWRHERPRLHHTNLDDGGKFTCGDPVASGVALTDELVFFTTNLSGKLSALDSRTGELLKEIAIGPVWCGPSISRGRVYVGSGSDLFQAWNSKEQVKTRIGFSLPKTEVGAVFCFGLPGDDGAPFSHSETCPECATN